MHGAASLETVDVPAHAHVRHEGLGEVLARRRGSVGADAVVLFERELVVVTGPERSGEGGVPANESRVFDSEGVAELVAQDVPDPE